MLTNLLSPRELSWQPIKRGYYRRSASTVDVRRCPDAAVGCGGRSGCSDSTSGCRGSLHNTTVATASVRGGQLAVLNGSGGDHLCSEGLTSVFCRLCLRQGDYYVPATDEITAHCAACDSITTKHSVVTVLAALVGLVALVLCAAPALWWASATWKKRAHRCWSMLLLRYSLPIKLKILVGFYQIATKVEVVYDVFLPTVVHEQLKQIQVVISLGIDGIPLACIGADGYIARLWFWTLAPATFMIMMACTRAITARVFRNAPNCRSAILEGALPVVLRVAFLSYTLVTNVAFGAILRPKPWRALRPNPPCTSSTAARIDSPLVL